VVEPSDAGLHPSQHLESHSRPLGNPNAIQSTGELL
jgi:hypothetical protein